MKTVRCKAWQHVKVGSVLHWQGIGTSWRRVKVVRVRPSEMVGRFLECRVTFLDGSPGSGFHGPIRWQLPALSVTLEREVDDHA